MTAANRLLEVRELEAFYASAQALFGLSFHVDEGEVLALVGPNGAGKSTTLRSIAGWIDRWEGSMTWMGRSLKGMESHQIAALGIALVPEDRRIFSSLTVEENLRAGLQVLRQRPASARLLADPWTMDKVLTLFPVLATMLKRPAGQMSGGEQQMLSIARGLMGQPQLLLLDEPSEGVAPKIVEAMAEAILAMKQSGLSILLSEQNRFFCDAIADRQLLLNQGLLQGEIIAAK